MRGSASLSRSSTEPAGERRLRIGRVGRPHGTDGTFGVSEPTPRPGLLAVGAEIEIGGSPTRISSRAGSDERPLISVEGIADREQVRARSGAEITVARSQIGELGQGEYLVDDLIGLPVFDGSRAVGRVRDVLLLPSADVLDVERPDGSQLLVPLITDAIRSVDTDRIDVRLAFLGAEE